MWAPKVVCLSVLAIGKTGDNRQGVPSLSYYDSWDSLQHPCDYENGWMNI